LCLGQVGKFEEKNNEVERADVGERSPRQVRSERGLGKKSRQNKGKGKGGLSL